LQVIAQLDTRGSSIDRLLTYENSKYGFRISYPANWACQQPSLPLSSQPLIITLCPIRQNIDSYTIHSLLGDIMAQRDELSVENKLNDALERTASLSIWVFPSFNQPLDRYVNDKIRELQGYSSNNNVDSLGSAPDFNLIHITPNYNIGNNIPAYEVDYSFTLEGHEKQVKAIWTIKGDQAYEFVYLSDPSIYSTYLPVAQSIVNSFEFTS